MKFYMLSFVLLFYFNILLGQETFRKSYKIEKAIVLEGEYTIYLLKEEGVVFKDLNQREQDSIRKVYPVGTKVVYSFEGIASSGKGLVSREVIVDANFYNEIKITKPTVAKSFPTDREGYVKFEDNGKIVVNPNLSGVTYADIGLYYYQLSNRQTIKLKFTEWNVTALTIPLKYRFKIDDVSEEFTSAVNINFFAGHTFCGKTRFHFRDKVGNITATTKWTVGALAGSSTVTLNKGNTSSSKNPITDDTEIIKGLATLGVGGSYSYNKINIGVFFGWDFSIGDNANRWNYNKKPWAGIAIGYSLLPFSG